MGVETLSSNGGRSARLKFSRMRPTVISLAPSDAERYVALRRRMLMEAPWAFSSTLEDDLGLDVNFLRTALSEAENAILAVEAPESGTLVAAAGTVRDKKPKFSHRAKLWGVFVEPRYRGQGLGRAVVTAALEVARRWDGIAFVDLGVSANSPEAHSLYKRLGFVEWGREPEATVVNGQRYDEIHMSLRVERPVDDE